MRSQSKSKQEAAPGLCIMYAYTNLVYPSACRIRPDHLARHIRAYSLIFIYDTGTELGERKHLWYTSTVSCRCPINE